MEDKEIKFLFNIIKNHGRCHTGVHFGVTDFYNCLINNNDDCLPSKAYNRAYELMLEELETKITLYQILENF